MRSAASAAMRSTAAAAARSAASAALRGPPLAALLVAAFVVAALGAADPVAAQAPGRGLAERTAGPAMKPVSTSSAYLLRELREAWFAAVEEKAWIDVGLARLQDLERRDDVSPALVTAYRGAFDLLRSKHTLAPLARLRHARAGLAALDTAVAAAPDQAEVRYVRLMSCYHLPFFFGRGDSVTEDFRSLGTLLPAVRDAYPAAWWDGAVRFVLEHGELDRGQKEALAQALDRSGAAGGIRAADAPETLDTPETPDTTRTLNRGTS